MDLVDDIYSVFQLCGGEGYLILHIPDVIDTVIACGVHLYNVRRGSRIDAATSGAFVAGVTRPGIETVHSLRQYFGTGGLSRSSRAAEKICVRELIIGYLVFENIRNGILTRDVVEMRGSPFTV